MTKDLSSINFTLARSTHLGCGSVDRRDGAAVRGVLALEAVLVHDPAGLAAPGGPSRVEHERLLHADEGLASQDLPVLAGRLPVPGLRGPVRPQPRRVLAVLDAEEVPFLLPPCGPSCARVTSMIINQYMNKLGSCTTKAKIINRDFDQGFLHIPYLAGPMARTC
jgi:hypothetical protein